MDGVQYDVSAVLKVSGAPQFKSELGGAAKAADGLQDSLTKIAGGAREMFGGLAGVAATAAKAFAGVAAVGVGAGTMALSAIGKNLSMLEDKSIQLTGVVAAATEQEYGKVAASTRELFEQFKKDATTSAGETSDFVDTASKIAAPILGAGKSMAELREITKGVIATAPALGVEFKQAGSDVMRMLQGSAGADLPFFQALKAIPSLGIQSAEAFNALDPAKRITTIQKALTNPAFIAASDAMGGTWTGLLSTMQDQLKAFGGMVAGPTFGLVQKQFANLTGWLTSKLDASSLKTDIEGLGDTIAKRFGQVGQQLRRIFPFLASDAEGAFRTIARGVDTVMGKMVEATKWVADHWTEIKDGASRAADAIARAASFAADLLKTIGGGDMVRGLERVAQAFLAVQAAQLAAPVVGGAIQIGKGVAGVAGSALGAGAAGAGAAGTAVTLGAFGAAIAGVGAAAYQATQYLKESKGFLSPDKALKNDNYEAMGAAFAEFGQGKREMAGPELMALRQKYVDLALEIGENAAEAGRYVDQMIVAHDALGQKAADQTAAFQRSADEAVASNDIYRLADVYNEAIAANNTAAARYAAAALLAGDQSAKALEQAGHALAGGYEKFNELLALTPGATMAKLMDFFEKKVGGSSANPTKPKPNAPAGGKHEIVLKVELGEGNEAAIYLRSGRSVGEAIRQGRAFFRGPPPRSGF